jgi:cell division protease FtsH
MAMPKDFSESTAKIIDDEVRKIITEKEEELMNLFETHKKEIITLSDKLVEKELIYADEIKALIDL